MAPEWTEERLKAYIDGEVEEGHSLEYKAAASLGKQNNDRDEITKDISAFANASGGIIIYGIREFREESRKHLPERFDPVDRVQYPKERLEHVIGVIQPRIKATIHTVQFSSGLNNVAYVVEIERGETAHQAADGRYYQRQNFERPVMQDYQIRDVMTRRKHLIINAHFHILLGKFGLTNKVFWRLSNQSDAFARYVMLELRIPIKLRNRYIYFRDAPLEHDSTGYFWKLKASNRQRPLFPHSDLHGEFRFRFQSSIKDLEGNPITQIGDQLAYRIFADDMAPVRGVETCEPLITVSSTDEQFED